MNRFDVLPFSEKMKVIKSSAEVVGQFSYHDEIVVLYRIGNIVVEQVNDPRSNKITKICCMDHAHFFMYLPHLGVRSILRLMLN
jgi:hypothetical protein